MDVTAVWIRRQVGDRVSSVEYQLNELCHIPQGKGRDKVIRIYIDSEPLPHVGIEFEKWGTLWVLNNIEEIHYARDREILPKEG